MSEPSRQERKDSMSKSIEIGEIGEQLTQQWLINKFGKKNIRNVADDRRFQPLDIDIIVRDNRPVNPKGYKGFEVKTDTTNTPNIFFELWSNYDRRIKGWTLTTKTDYLVYMFPNHHPATVYVINMPAFRQWVHVNMDSFRLVEFKRRSRDNKRVTTKGLLVPIADMLASGQGHWVGNHPEILSGLDIESKKLLESAGKK